MIQLYNCDFRSIIKDLDFDLIITDPPYNKGFNYNEYDDRLDDQDYISMLSYMAGYKSIVIHYPEATMQYLVPALGVPKKSAAWCYNYNASFLPRCFRLINFYNIEPNFRNVTQAYKNPTDRRVKRLIRKGSPGAWLYDWFDDIQLVKNTSKEKNGHPCQIPEKLIERILLLATKEGDTVLDPFMGSGTVPAVCKRMNRKYIGIEMDPVYFAIAKARVDQETIECKLDTYTDISVKQLI